MYSDGSDVGLLVTDGQIISKFEQVSLVIIKIFQTLSVMIFNVHPNSTAMSMKWNVISLNNNLFLIVRNTDYFPELAHILSIDKNIFTVKFRENTTLAKISEFTVLEHTPSTSNSTPFS